MSVQATKAKVDAGEIINYAQLDVHVAANLITLYLRQLPDSVFPIAQHGEWIRLGAAAEELRFTDDDVGLWQRNALVPPYEREKASKIKDFLIDLSAALKRVSRERLEVLRWLVKLLESVAQHRDENKMGLGTYTRLFKHNFKSIYLLPTKLWNIAPPNHCIGKLVAT